MFVAQTLFLPKKLLDWIHCVDGNSPTEYYFRFRFSVSLEQVNTGIFTIHSLWLSANYRILIKRPFFSFCFFSSNEIYSCYLHQLNDAFSRWLATITEWKNFKRFEIWELEKWIFWSLISFYRRTNDVFGLAWSLFFVFQFFFPSTHLSLSNRCWK